MANSEILTIQETGVYANDRVVLDDVNLGIERGAVTAVFGHNGAGKSSLLRAIAGLNRTTKGSRILFENEEIQGLSAMKRADLGIRLVPQGGGVFPNLSVLENFEIQTKGAASPEECFEYFPELQPKANEYGGNLSGGQRQMLAVSLSLLAKPKLLVLDEPSVGLQPNLVQNVLNVISRFATEHQTTCLLVEQNIEGALSIAQRVVVLNQGKIVLDQSAAGLDTQQVWESL